MSGNGCQVEAGGLVRALGFRRARRIDIALAEQPNAERRVADVVRRARDRVLGGLFIGFDATRHSRHQGAVRLPGRDS